MEQTEFNRYEIIMSDNREVVSNVIGICIAGNPCYGDGIFYSFSCYLHLN